MIDYPTLRNKLGEETSPYLLQHRDNPVHWQPWSRDVFRLARELDRPVLLSIGYAACHWCHVMAHESFENPGVSAKMNDLFINVKVDREERPDVDNIYQSALALLGEQGGWPLTMFLTPEGKPFWGGTYFPSEARFGRPAFATVLDSISRTYHDRPEAIQKNTAAIKEALGKLSAAPKGAAIAIDAIDGAAKIAVRMIDSVHGGVDGAPKFPQPSFFGFIWNAFLRTRSPLFRDAVTTTLDRMAEGGIYDHLGGGYARYSVDHAWLVPHFEKMLYDNALLVDLMTSVWKETRSELYRRRIAETMDWLNREMTVEAKSGGRAYASAYDADSEGEEGKFYVWTEAEVDLALGDKSSVFKEFYDVTEHGNWEGKNILRRVNASWDGDPAALEEKLSQARDILMEIRAKRIRPERDHKVLADWNGLAIAALVHAGAVFEKPGWIAMGKNVYDFIAREMSDGDRLFHTWCREKARHPGILDDYAAMSRAAVRLFELTGDRSCLDRACRWADVAEDLFRDEDGGYFMTASDTTDIFTRPKSHADNAAPSGNGLMAEVLIKLHTLTGESRFLKRAEALFEAFGSDKPDRLINMPTLLNAFEAMVRARQIIVVGEENDADATDLWTTVLTTSGPTGAIMRIAPETSLPNNHPAADKRLVDGKAAAYFCEGGTCGPPIQDPRVLMNKLKAARPHGRPRRNPNAV